MAGKKPEAQARAETRIEFAPVDQVESAERPIEIAHEVVPAPRPQPTPKEIQGRVAAFRAHQQLFDRERDAYFNTVLTKVHASIGSRTKAPGA